MKNEQLKLNFNETNQPEKSEKPKEVREYKLRTMFSIREHLDKKEQEEENRINELKKIGNREKFRYIEDVPDWENKLKKYNLQTYHQKLLKEGKLIHNYSDSAAIITRDINDKFPTKEGEEPYAMYENRTSASPFARGANNTMWYVRIKMFSMDDFMDILDKKGNLLPSRNSNKLAS